MSEIVPKYIKPVATPERITGECTATGNFYLRKVDLIEIIFCA